MTLPLQGRGRKFDYKRGAKPPYCIVPLKLRGEPEILPGPYYMENKNAFLGIISGIFIGFSLVIMSFVTKTVHPFVYSTFSAALSIPFLVLVSLFFSGDGLMKIIREERRDFVLTLVERFILASGILLTFGGSIGGRLG